MSAIDHSRVPSADTSWPGAAGSSARSLRELIGEYAQALRATAMAERNHRHAKAIRALYVDDPESRQTPE